MYILSIAGFKQSFPLWSFCILLYSRFVAWTHKLKLGGPLLIAVLQVCQEMEYSSSTILSRKKHVPLLSKLAKLSIARKLTEGLCAHLHRTLYEIEHGGNNYSVRCLLKPRILPSADSFNHSVKFHSSRITLKPINAGFDHIRYKNVGRQFHFGFRPPAPGYS